MADLFRIETDRVSLEWGEPRGKAPSALWSVSAPPGRLSIRQRRQSLKFGEETWRSQVPTGVAHDFDQVAGPRLFEQTDYSVVLRSKTGASVELRHRDPVILRDIKSSGKGDLVHGVVNFASQVGRSEFSVLVGSDREIDFEIEVFPTKLDYLGDYESLLAEVQDILTGLVLEYLRSTFNVGAESRVPQPTHLEWLTLLRHVITDLEKALRNIARQPVRATVRTVETVRADRVKKTNSQLRSVILRGGGRGATLRLESGLELRQKLVGTTANATLDTAEHRWLACQLDEIRRHLSRLRRSERERDVSARREATLKELADLEQRISEMLQLEPMRASIGHPPPGFASMQLLSVPGYREAYKCCTILSFGLRLSGGPVRLAVKDLSLLYEYWCYLTIVRLSSELTGQAISVRDLLGVEQNGLRVLLQKGRERTIPFNLADGRRLAVTYNPRFQNEPLLVAQQPDFVLTLFDRDWPNLRLVVDAKYRIDCSGDYLQKYCSAGPPEDAVNVMHRYRDAIMDSEPDIRGKSSAKRSVIQGVVLFPYREERSGAFRESRLWDSLHRLGIGALPALPGNCEYLRDWLTNTFRTGGWAIAEKVIPHHSRERSADWRMAAAEPVLVGVLRPDEEREHLDWIRQTRQYYVPATKQLRQYNTRYVALYLPTALRKVGAVTCWAAVKSIEVVRRDAIKTAWQPRRPETDHVLYKLEEVRDLKHPIENRTSGPRGSGPRSPRWTSRLGLQRAATLQELFLETEPEWRLYEDLRAMGLQFSLEAGPVRVEDPDDPRGRGDFRCWGRPHPVSRSSWLLDPIAALRRLVHQRHGRRRCAAAGSPNRVSVL